jgi:hypothetical protein
MIDKKEKIYLTSLISTVIILIFIIIYLTYRCPESNIYKMSEKIKPIVIYKVIKN